MSNIAFSSYLFFNRVVVRVGAGQLCSNKAVAK